MKIYIMAASSGIAKHMAAIYAKRGDQLLLAGRDQRDVERIAADLRVRYDASAEAVALDPAVAATCDLLVLAAGFLGKEKPEYEDDIVRGNYSALIPYIDACAGKRIVALSSVAGDRLRKSNYMYGAAKARLNAYLGKLPNTTIVKLGPVDTEMSFDLEKHTISPQEAARGCVEAGDRGDDVAYVPAIWKPIMMIVRRLPQRIVDRL